MKSLITKTRREAILALVANLRGNYRSQWNEDVEKNAGRILGLLWDEIGPEKTQKAVTGCLAREEFFNEVSLRRHIPSSDPHDKPTCPRCKDSSGFITVKMPNGDRVAKSCKHDPFQRVETVEYMRVKDSQHTGPIEQALAEDTE